jgi:hypothetical protein
MPGVAHSVYIHLGSCIEPGLYPGSMVVKNQIYKDTLFNLIG